MLILSNIDFRKAFFLEVAMATNRMLTTNGTRKNNFNYYNENSDCIQSDWHCTSNKAI